MENREVAVIFNQWFFGAVCAWAGYMWGKVRGWDEPYNLGHEHGVTIGRLDEWRRIVNAKPQPSKSTGNAGEATGER